MNKKALKNFLIRLAVIALADAVAAFVGYLADGMFGGGISPVFPGVIASAVFLIYSFYNSYKMKKPGNGTPPLLFALVELLPYLVFIAPLAVFGALGTELALYRGFLGFAYAPHISVYLSGYGIIANILVYAALFFAVNLAFLLPHPPKETPSSAQIPEYDGDGECADGEADGDDEDEDCEADDEEYGTGDGSEDVPSEE